MKKNNHFVVVISLVDDAIDFCLTQTGILAVD